MVTNTRILKQVLTLICSVSFLYAGISHASILQVNARGGLIDIHAEDSALIDILKTVSSRAGIVIKTDQPMLERVSCDFNGLELDRAVQRLMTQYGYSHVIFYDKNSENQIVVTQIHISGRNPGNVAGLNELPVSPEAVKPPEDPIKPFKKEWYKKAFANRMELAKSISVKPVLNSPEGIQVTSVDETSVFATLGLTAGDVIKHINQMPVRSVDDLINGLNPELLPPVIRIEREDEESLANPIYIQLN